MPPTYVRPQTFAVFQQPDSDSPSVQSRERLNTCCLDIIKLYEQFLPEPHISSYQGGLYLLLGFRFSVQGYCLTPY